MYEGEILFEEKYGSSERYCVYINSQDQNRISVVDKSRVNNTNEWLTKVFLPQGFPDSVSKDYISYQIWDTAQAFCSTITGTLALQEVLRGVGVGSAEASPIAATITWVIKDGCGHLGRILFAYSYGTFLDAYSKMWRLYADVLNDVAMCLEMVLPHFSQSTTLILCTSTAIKAIVGVAGGATRAALTQHHAVRGNMADVAAKDAAQETAVNLVASFTALAIVSVFGSSYFIFVLMIALHITFNYLAVRSVCLKTFNKSRFLQVIESYICKQSMLTPKSVNYNEPLVLNPLDPDIDVCFCGFNILIGSSIKNYVKYYPSQVDFKALVEIYKDQKYILYPSIFRKEMYILLKNDADSNDILNSYFHAVVFCILICAVNGKSLSIYNEENEGQLGDFEKIMKLVVEAEWSREHVTVEPHLLSDLVYSPTMEMAAYVNNLVIAEWASMQQALQLAGWDLTKNLLIVDEWRIFDKQISIDFMQLGMTAASINNLEKSVRSFGHVALHRTPSGHDHVRVSGAFTIEPEVSSNRSPSQKITETVEAPQNTPETKKKCL